MTVRELIEKLQLESPNAEVGVWRYSIHMMKFQPVSDVSREVVKSHVHVGLEFGQYTTTTTVKEWEKEMSK